MSQTGKETRCLGLIGGLGPSATVHYYRELLAVCAKHGRVPRLLIAHADVDHAYATVSAKDYETLARYLAGLTANLAADEIDRIHNIYRDFVAERGTAAQSDELRKLAQAFVTRDGAQAVLIAGTDLSMVFNEGNAGFPMLDCARVHIDAIVQRMLS